MPSYQRPHQRVFKASVDVGLNTGAAKATFTAVAGETTGTSKGVANHAASTEIGFEGIQLERTNTMSGNLQRLIKLTTQSTHLAIIWTPMKN